MTPDQRMKWDAEAAFKRIEGQELERREDGNTVPDAVWFDKQAMKAPYTPSPNVAAWLRAQSDKPKPRDYDAILRAAKKAPVGYYEDAPTGIKFGKPPVKPVVRCIPRKPAPTQSADGGTPLIGMCGVERLWFGGMEYLARSRAMPCRRDAAMRWWQNTRTPTIPEMYSWLEQNGHADVAAQLRGKATAGAEEFEPLETKVRIGDRITARLDKGDTGGMGAFTVAHINEHGVFGPDTNPHLTSQDYLDAGKRRILKRPQAATPPRDDVATGGGRVWRGACCDWAVIGERCYIGPSRRDMKGGWEDSKCDPNKMPDHWPELFGPERDAIIAECRKAMGI